MIFSIAGIRIKLSDPHNCIPQTSFISAVAADYSVPENSAYEWKLIFDDGAPIQHDLPPPGKPVIQNPSSRETIIYQSASVCTINWLVKTATVVIAGAIEDADILCFDYMRLLFSFVIVQTGGIPMHCSAVVNNNVSIVFCGPSRIGKSTIASLLAPQWTVLNDDINFIVPRENGFQVYSTPFVKPCNYHLTINSSGRLGVVFCLRQASQNSVADMTLQQKVQSLMMSFYTLPVTPEIGNRMLENVDALCKQIVVRELSFSKNVSIGAFVESLM